MTDNYIKNFNFVRDSIIKKLIFLKDKYENCNLWCWTYFNYVY